MRFTTRDHYEKDGRVYIRCNRCGEFRDSDSYTTYKEGNAFMNKGSYCKECRAEYRKAHREKNHEYTMKYNIENRDRMIEWKRRYNKEHAAELEEKRKIRVAKMGYGPLHSKTNHFIARLGNRPKICPICGSDKYRVEAHHPSNDVRNEIVFCCQSCHSGIHNGFIECPKPIDLLSIRR